MSMRKVAFREVAKWSEFKLPVRTERSTNVRMSKVARDEPGECVWRKTGDQSYELVKWSESAFSQLTDPDVTLRGCTLSVSSPRVKVWVEG